MDDSPSAVTGDTAEQLANRHFDALNAMSLERWFVDYRSRPRFIRSYVDFIGDVGAHRFEELALLQERAAPDWSNNVAFDRLLQRQFANSISKSMIISFDREMFDEASELLAGMMPGRVTVKG